MNFVDVRSLTILMGAGASRDNPEPMMAMAQFGRVSLRFTRDSHER